MSLIGMGNAYSMSARDKQMRQMRKERRDEVRKIAASAQISSVQAFELERDHREHIASLDGAMETVYNRAQAAPYDSRMILGSLKEITDHLSELYKENTQPEIGKQISRLESMTDNFARTLEHERPSERRDAFIQSAADSLFTSYQHRLRGRSFHDAQKR